MSWVKQHVIAGDPVTVGVLWAYGCDNEVPRPHRQHVTNIGTNHDDPTDPTYYPDDVLSWDDHGLFTLEHGQITGNPAVPPGTGADVDGCTPYVYSDTFANLGRDRADMPIVSSVPRREGPTRSGSGVQPYAFATPVANGLLEQLRVRRHRPGRRYPADTLPVTLTITGTSTGGVANPITRRVPATTTRRRSSARRWTARRAPTPSRRPG